MKLTTLLSALHKAHSGMLHRDYPHNARHYNHIYVALNKRLTVADGRCKDCRVWERFVNEIGPSVWGTCHYEWLPVRPIIVKYQERLDTHEAHGCRTWQPEEEAHGDR